MDPSPILYERFDAFAVRDDKLILARFKKQHQGMSFTRSHTPLWIRIPHILPSTVYRILKKNDLITLWYNPVWESTRAEHLKSFDRYQGSDSYNRRNVEIVN